MSAEDVRSVLEAVGEAGAGPEPTAEVLAAEVRRVTAQVRRRRATRAAGLVVGAAAAVVIGAIGVQALDAPAPAPPAQTGTPSPTSERVPTEEPVPEPTGAPLGEVTEHPLLPAASALREGMLEASTDDWRLVTYQPRTPDGPGPVAYLMDPVGALYEVPTPLALGLSPGDGGTTAVHDWLPGTSLVLVGETSGAEGPTGFTVRDVLTGATVGDLTDLTGGDTFTEARFVRDGTTDVLVTRTGLAWDTVTVAGTQRTTADGAPVWTREGFTAPDLATVTRRAVLPSPDGTRLLLNDGAPRHESATDRRGQRDVPLPAGAGECVAELWWGDAHVVLGCGATSSDRTSSGTDRTELWLVPVDAGEPVLLTDDAAGVVPLLVVDDRLVATHRDPDTEGRIAFTRDGRETPLPSPQGAGWQPYGTIDGRVLTTGTADGDLVALDPWTGTASVLLRSPGPADVVVTGQGH